MKNPLVIIRILTAAVLFLMLAKANIWADTQTHLTLAVGYRAFLLVAPAFLFFGLSNGMKLSLGLGVLSILSAFFSFNYLAMGLFAISMAVSGFILKYVNSHSSRGAADNKVALNIGSLLSGILVMFIEPKLWLLVFSFLAIAVTFWLSLKIKWPKEEDKEKNSDPGKKLSFLPFLGWSLIGVATGIKLTGVFTILPQFLIHKMGLLPNWYGSLIILNSLGVIFIQHQVLKILDRSKKNLTLLFSLSAMLLLAAPGFMNVQSLPMAILWIALLTLGECALSRYDTLAKIDGYLFPKELAVGAGSLLTVLLSRKFPEYIHLSGLIGAICLYGGFLITRVSFTR